MLWTVFSKLTLVALTNAFYRLMQVQKMCRTCPQDLNLPKLRQGTGRQLFYAWDFSVNSLWWPPLMLSSGWCKLQNVSSLSSNSNISKLKQWTTLQHLCWPYLMFTTSWCKLKMCSTCPQILIYHSLSQRTRLQQLWFGLSFISLWCPPIMLITGWSKFKIASELF